MWTTSTSSAATSSSELSNARSAPSAAAALRRADGRRGGDADEVRAREPGGPGVYGADEPGAGDGRHEAPRDYGGHRMAASPPVKQKFAW